MSLGRQLREGGAAVLDLVFPRHCGICGSDVGSEGTGLCWDCRAGFALVEDPFCERCGDPVDGMVEHSFQCRWCRSHRVYFDLARSALRYRDGVMAAVQAFKYDRNASLVPDLVAFMVACVTVHYPDVLFDAVTFVPLHHSKRRARTFNQSQLLADRLARALGGLGVMRTLTRVKGSGSQTNLTARARRANVRGAFTARDPGWIQGRTFLLVDDVMTTGATVAECSRILKEAGAAGVYVVTVARG